MTVLRKLWNDDSGFVISSELVLVATILVIGLVVGLTEVRNQVVQELTDVAQAVGFISQGYQVYGTLKTNVAQTDGFGYDDEMDFCQATTNNAEDSPGGISVQQPPVQMPNAADGED